MLELYHHGSSACAAKVRLALGEKNLSWTSRYIDILSGEQFRPDFLSLNPKAVDEELHPACSAITYTVSHRHTILRNGAGSFEEFLNRGTTDGAAARALKWAWIQHGLEAPGAADKIKLYDSYLRMMERALLHSDWLVGDGFSMADIALAPYLNRLDALAMDGLWRHGRLPRVEAWFERIRARPAFSPALLDWMPAGLTQEMRANGEKTWPEIRALLGFAG